MEEGDYVSPETERVLGLISELFPKETGIISEIASLTWLNLLNHSDMRDLNEKQLLFTAALVLTLASANFQLKSEQTAHIANKIQEISFDDMVGLLQKGSTSKQQNKTT